MVAIVFLSVMLAVATLVGAIVWKYRRIVSARPGQLHTAVQPKEFGQWVNPFLGTGGVPWVCGNNFPGAMVPFGVMRLGPETVSMLGSKRAINSSGYYYGDDRLLGFSHTRLNGTGAVDGGHFLVRPTRRAASTGAWRKGKATGFDHSHEIASPGYYAVDLPEEETLVELTATPRVGIHRYTFKGRKPAHILINVANALGGRRSTEGLVRIIPETRSLEGHIRTFGTFAGRYGGLTVYFAARCDQPFTRFAIWREGILTAGAREAQGNLIGADLALATSGKTKVVTVKLAISHVSIENARANLDAEAGGKSFEQALAEAQQAWEDRLSLVRIEGGTEKQKRIFYTALYRCFQMPTVFNDANGDYIGFDSQVHHAEGFRYFTDLSLWDTFRTVHPLYTLIAPGDQRDMIVSLLKMLAQGGWLPRWPSGHGYSNSMLGTPADIVIAEAYLKGIREFDIQAAYQAMRQTALAPVPPGSRFSGREGVEHYLRYGYCPSGLMKESVARTFEFGWADSSIAALAAALGKPGDAELFREHSRFYRNLWNPQTQYFQPRDVQGKFFEPFKPLLLTYLDRKGKYTRDYVEGSALQWRWAAPFDAQGMIGLFKSRQYFVEQLDQFFAKADPGLGNWNPGPYYWHGNQPDLHAAYLFNDAGRPDLTQKWVGWILEHKYGDGYDGLDGNDDGGTLSAWYTFSALGLYPVAGSDQYQIGAPLFQKSAIRVGDKLLTIEADDFGPDRCYVRGVSLNGRPRDNSRISHRELVHGGTLRFNMSREPTVRSASSAAAR